MRCIFYFRVCFNIFFNFKNISHIRTRELGLISQFQFTANLGIFGTSSCTRESQKQLCYQKKKVRNNYSTYSTIELTLIRTALEIIEIDQMKL